MARYRHVSKDLPEAWTNMALAQYIGHAIFKEGGLINRYIYHSGLNHLSDEELVFLKFQAKHPRRFSFEEITSQADEHFLR